MIYFVIYLGKLIEPLWGTKEMSFFFCLVNLSVSVLSVTYYLFLYMATSDPDTLFTIQIHGLAGYIACEHFKDYHF
jgi:hypothetical protein